MSFLLGIDPDPPVRKATHIKKLMKKPLQRWTKRFIIFLFIVVVGAFLLGLMEFALESPNYAIKKIEIYGLESTPTEIFLKQMGLNIKGKNFFLISARTLEKILLSKPTIAYCKVIKIFPDTIKIIVREEIPFATLSIGDNLYLIDHTARILKKIYSIKERVGPIITGIELLSEVREGDYIDDEGLWGAMEFWYEFNQIPKKLNLTVSEIVVDKGSLKIFFNEIPCETRWKRNELKYQLQKFTLAMRKIDIKKIPCYEYLDFRFGDDIIFR